MTIRPEYDELTKAPGLRGRFLHDVRTPLLVRLAKTVYVCADMDSQLTRRLTTKLIVSGKAEMDVDRLTIGATSGLDSPVHRRTPVEEVDLEPQDVRKVLCRRFHISNGQDRLNTMKLMPGSKARRHGGWRLP